jgi:hypothetical protein
MVNGRPGAGPAKTTPFPMLGCVERMLTIHIEFVVSHSMTSAAFLSGGKTG